MNNSFFSISFDLINLDGPMPYDLFVNSSTLEGKERYVRVFPIGEILTAEDVRKFKNKYSRLYIPESQRNLYLQSLVKQSQITAEEKTEVIKDSAIHYLGKVFDPDREFTTEVLNQTMEGCRESVESMVDVLQDHNIDQLRDLIGNLSFHDFYTYDHSINVSMYCIGLYRALVKGATRDELVLAGMGGLLHDLGKIKIPTEIINHAGKLTDDMFKMIQLHPGHGKDLLEEEGVACEGVDLEIIKRVVFEHHENFNGSGYPCRVDGENIHLMARVCAVADFFDAITTKRSYHEAMGIEEALHVMSKSVGVKLDPKVFEVFVKNAKVLLKEGKMNYQLPDDFDPCQPHDQLPLEEIQKHQSKRDYGKVTFEDRMKPKKKKAA